MALTPSVVSVGNMVWDETGGGYVVNSDGTFAAMDSRFDLPVAHGSVGSISREGSRLILVEAAGAGVHYADLNGLHGWVEITSNFP